MSGGWVSLTVEVMDVPPGTTRKELAEICYKALTDAGYRTAVFYAIGAVGDQGVRDLHDSLDMDDPDQVELAV